MSVRAFILATVPLFAAVVAVPAAAVSIFNVTLSAANEVPPTVSAGMGNGTLMLSDDMNTLFANISFTNLTAPALKGHVHCCAPIGSDAAVAIPLSVTPAKSGMLTGMIDLTKLSSYDAEFLAAYGSSVTTLRSTFLSGLEGGLAYVNLHTATYPTGEIRGQAAAAATGAVPEPSAWLLMITGFGLVGAAVRRRHVNTVAA